MRESARLPTHADEDAPTRPFPGLSTSRVGGLFGPPAHLRRGVRRLETLAPEHRPAFAATVAAPTGADCTRALRSSIDLYLQLRDESGVVCRKSAEHAVLDYVVDAGP